MPMQLVFMCTANRCRSPMAAAIGGAELKRRGVDAVVRSCGEQPGGAHAVHDAVAVMSRRGHDLSDHLSRQIDLDIATSADLILTMERRHLLSVAELGLGLVDRAFTLRELAGLAPFVGRRSPDESVSEWIERAHRSRPPATTLALGTGDDVPDPIGRSRRAFRAVADELERLIGTIFDQLFPLG
jgi:protein-tyrosine-phosphatase